MVAKDLVKLSDRQPFYPGGFDDSEPDQAGHLSRFAWGSGMNVALSMASFLVALAAGVMLDGDRHARDAPSATSDPLSAASPAGPSDAMARE